MTNDQKRTEVEEWGLASTRFTVFSSTYSDFESAHFEEFFGFPPDNQTQRKAQFINEFSSTREQTIYQLSVAGPKIDAMVSAGLQVGDLHKGLPVLPDSAEIRRMMRRVAGLLIDKVSDVHRLAVGEQLLMSATSRVEANRALATFLPSVKIDPEGSFDFFYRINRPRGVDLNGGTLVLNRLSQWSHLPLNVVMTAAEISKTAVIGDAVSLITDINSRAEDNLSTLNIDQKNTVIDKLFAFSKELAQEGDSK